MDQTARVLDSAVRVRTIGSYEELDRARAQWQGKLNSGQATREDLIEWILTIDDAGFETIPTSMGMAWIAGNPRAFKALVDDVDAFVLELGERYEEAVESGAAQDGLRELGVWFFRCFLCARELAELLSARMREAWVSRIYPRLGAINDRWVDHVRNAGVPRDVIATAILQRLENVRVEPGMANDLHDFLKGGATMEALLDEELERALMICARKSPAQTLYALDNLLPPRLSPETTERVLTTALAGLTSVEGVKIESLEPRLTLASREQLARQLKPASAWQGKRSAQFLFRLLCAIPQARRQDFFFEVVVPVIRDVNPARLYTAWRQLKLVEPNLEEELLSKLDREGYAVGFLQEGIVPSGKRQGQRQFYVDIGVARYVNERDLDRRFYPKAGLEVVFNARRAGMLVPGRIFVAVMTPVMYDLHN